MGVTALSPSDAWAGGGVSLTETANGTPIADHWNGQRWSISKLPAGLSGAIQVLRASAWNNVWAFGASAEGDGGFALRWNGHKWLLMKRWSGLTSVAGAVVRSPTNVWVFSRVTGIVQHYDGRRWRGVVVAPYMAWFDSVTTLPGGKVWAIGFLTTTEVVQGTVSGSGYKWNATTLTDFPGGQAGDELTDIYALSESNIWALGGDVRTVKGHDRWYPLAAHWNGHGWQPIKLSGNFTMVEAPRQAIVVAGCG